MALTRLADTTGTAQVGLCAMDRRAHTYDSLAPRVDPAMDASYKDYWAFHNPLWTLSTTRPLGEVFCLDSLIRRADFTATPVFNEWYRPAKFGLAMIAANLFIGDEVSALIGVANVPGEDEIMREQMHVFEAALPHIDRSVRIHRELRIRDLDHDTAPDRLENLQRSVLLVDGAARGLFANAAARRLLGSGGSLVIKGGSLHSTGDLDAIQGLIASCTRKGQTPNGHGDAAAVKGHRGGTSLARFGYSRGHCHRRRSGQGKMDAITGRGSFAG